MKKFIAAAAITLCTAMLGELTVYADEGVYSSLTEFSESGDIFSLPSETILETDSKSYEFAKTFEGAEEFYLEAALPPGDEMSIAVSGEGVYIKFLTPEPDENTPADMTIIIKDDTMYVWDNDAKAGYSTSAEGMSEELDADSIMEEFSGISMEVDTEAIVKSCTVNIGGKDYVFEHDGLTTGILFDGDEICAVYQGSVGVIIINKFSAEVPDGIFEIPADFQIENLDIALYGESAPAPDETVPAGDMTYTVSPETGNAPIASAAVTAAAMLAVMALTFKRTGK